MTNEEVIAHMDMLIANKNQALETHPYFERCDSCIHSEEQDGSNCYECVKGMADNFELYPTSDDDIIKALKTVRTIHNGNYAPQIDEAIRRLKAQPTDVDCVSRQAVLDTIGNVPDHNDGMVFEALSHAQRDVALLPSVAPKTVTEFADRCKECGKIKEDLYEKGFEAGKRYIVDQMCALLEKEAESDKESTE